MRLLMVMAVLALGRAGPALAASAVNKAVPAPSPAPSPAMEAGDPVSAGLIGLLAILLLAAFAWAGRRVHQARRRQERGRIRLR